MKRLLKIRNFVNKYLSKSDQQNIDNSPFQKDQQSRFANILFSKRTALVISFIFVLTIINFTFEKLVSPPTTSLPERERKIPQPKTYKYYEEKIDITLETTQEELNLPANLPVYNVTYDSLPEEKIIQLTENFNISDEPFVVDDTVVGKTFFYQSDDTLLRIIPSEKIIDYKSNKLTENIFNTIPDDSEIETIAYDFLLSNHFIENVNNIFVYNARFLHIDDFGHFVENQQPNMANIVFIKKINGYPIISSTFETGIISVNINYLKEVTSVYFDDIPTITSSEDYEVKNYDDIVRELNSSSSLQSVNNGKVQLLEIEPNTIKKSIINDIEIVYIQEIKSNSRKLQPSYLLTGTIEIENRGDYSSSFIMPALKTEFLKQTSF
jgi:hypothetical protein